MDDKIYDLLNDVKMNDELYHVEELSEIEKAKLKQAFTKKLQKSERKSSSVWRKAAVVIIVCLAFSVGTLYGKQFLTKREELSSISGAYRLDEDMKDYEVFLGKRMRGKDSTVTVDSVLWDGAELLIMTTRTFEKEVEMDDKPWLGVDISLNGEKLQSDMMSNSYRVDEYTFKQIMGFGIVGKELEEKVEAELCFYDIDDKQSEQWKFRFTIENERFKEDTVHIPIQKTYKVAGAEIEIVEFTRNALGDKILCRQKGELKEIKYLAIKGEDNLGNQVDFNDLGHSSYRGVEDSFSGKVVWTGDNVIIFYSGLLLLEEGRISKEADSVTLGLYVGDEPDSNYDGFEQVGETFTIELNEGH